MIRAETLTEAETAVRAKKRGLEDLSEGRGSLYTFDPRKLSVEPGWNSRLRGFDESDDDDIALARSIAEVGVKQPLTAYLRGGQAFITDGHRRLAATLYAIETLGAEILTVPVQPETKMASEADRVLSQLVRNQGKPLEPLEKGNVYAKLIGFGWSESEIAKKVGFSKQHVSDCLKLRAGPQAVVKLVQAGEISASLARIAIREHEGDDKAAAKVLTKAVKKAKSEGKTRATAKHLERPKVEIVSSPTGHPAYAAGLRRAAEIVRSAWEPDEMPNGIAKVIERIEAEIAG